jgi:hypothetical protein
MNYVNFTDTGLRMMQPQFVCSACGKRGADVRPDWRFL